MLRGLLGMMLGLASAGAAAHTYEAGQVWQYKTRPGEEASRLYIVKVETLSDGQPAFHIHLDKLKLANPRAPGQVQTELPHAPVSAKTLDVSVVALEGSTDALPDIDEGYAAWREAYDAGDAGVFTLSAVEIVDLIEDTVRQAGEAQP